MTSRPLLIFAALLLALVGIDALRRHGAASPPPATVTSTATDQGSRPTAAATDARQLGPLPGINATSAGTPTLDLMARLAVRRRLEREGNRVYLDSLLAKTDSVVVRWADRNDNPLTIRMLRDTTLPGWNDALFDDVRSAIQVWGSNAAGLRFREVAPEDSADITVHWALSVPDSGRVGITNMSWSPEGEVHGAEIILALEEGSRHLALSPAVRRRVAAHELGHAIGLPHSADRDDMMFPGTLVGTPSRRDQATLQLLYAVPPGTLRVPQ